MDKALKRTIPGNNKLLAIKLGNQRVREFREDENYSRNSPAPTIQLHPIRTHRGTAFKD